MKRRLCLLLFLILYSVMTASTYGQISERTLVERKTDPQKTEWFHQHKYGIMVHYLDRLQNSKQTINGLNREPTSWDQCVREFDVNRFADDVAATGAGYVLFTMMQQTRFLIAPNATYDRLTGYKPGEACATRDLVEDLYQALSARKIDLMLYWTGDGTTADPKAFQGLQGKIPVTEEYMRNWSAVVAEYGHRYKDKVKGWWVDGSYSWIGHNETTRGILAEGLLAGNPNRIIAFNPGVDPTVMAYSRYDDYTAGEQNHFDSMPSTAFLYGERWHILAHLGKFWGEPGCQRDKDYMAKYIWNVFQVGGVVTIDVMLYRDGGLDRSQVELLRAMRPLLNQLDRQRNAWKEGKAIPPRNMAWQNLALLVSNDDSIILPPSGGENGDAAHGVDGNLHTVATAANHWAWTYRVILPDLQTVSRIVLHFGSGYATDFELFAETADGKQVSLARRKNPDGQRQFEFKFTPLQTKSLRVRAYHPNGPDQPGVQMGIAELEVYEK